MTDLNKLKELYTHVKKHANKLRGRPEAYTATTGLCPVNTIELQAGSIIGLIERLEAAEKRVAELEESVTLVGHHMDTVRYINDLLENKITQLESEIARRDAAAGDPVAWVVPAPQGDYIERNAELVAHLEATGLATCRPLYAAPQPAVLPPEFAEQAEYVSFILEMIGSFDASDIDNDTVDLRFEVDDVDTGSDVSITEYATKGAGIIRSLVTHTKALGCQPPKEFVVKAPFLPHDCDRTEAHYKYISAIKAAGGSIAE